MKSTGGRSRFQMLIQPAILPTHPHFTYILYLSTYLPHLTRTLRLSRHPLYLIPSILSETYNELIDTDTAELECIYKPENLFIFLVKNNRLRKISRTITVGNIVQVDIWEKLSAMLRAHYQQVKHKSASFIHPHYHTNSIYISHSLCMAMYSVQALVR